MGPVSQRERDPNQILYFLNLWSMSFLTHPQKFRIIATKTETVEKTMFLCYNNDCYKISMIGPDVAWAFFSFWAKITPLEKVFYIVP